MNDVGRQMMVVAMGASSYARERGDQSAWERLAQSWMRCGFPQVVPSHRLAASLAATSVPVEHAGEIAVPWSTFLILVPSGTLPGGYDGKQEDEVEGIWVTSAMSTGSFEGDVHPADGAEMSVAVAAVHSSKIALGSPHRGVSIRRASDIRGLVALMGSESGNSDTMAKSARRSLGMACHLALGIMLELDTPKMREQIGRGAPNKSKRRPGVEPKAWTFTLSRDVKVDVREAVRTYCLGGSGKSPTVQVLVRGHHKRQACGPGLSERKWIHIEPYWRGPEDAPIGVRSHVMEEA